MIKKGLLVAVSIVLLSGCNQQNIAVDQESLCEVSGWQKDVTAASCKAGQKVVFLPSSFGNEQLPVIFAAVNCDHRFSIALTKGGVSCIYSPLKADGQDKPET
ncbi:hypothetical protein [Spongiibacter tropicus]|uniref:hypothetical protein n=1 Tax=Spongiibacter tropicus TaxID=454602 RepID=UPI0035BE33C2